MMLRLWLSAGRCKLMKPPSDRSKLPCAFIILVIVTLVLLLFLSQTYGAFWSSTMEPVGRGGSGGILDSFVNGVRGLGQGLMDVFNNIMP